MGKDFSQDFEVPRQGEVPVDDARALVAHYGDDAGVQAHFFVLLESEGISVDHPLGHWAAVESAVAKILSGRL